MRAEAPVQEDADQESAPSEDEEESVPSEN